MTYRIFILLLLFNQSFAQTLTFKWADKVITEGDFHFCGRADSIMYTVQKKNNKTVYIRSYKPGLDLKNETTVAFDNAASPSSHLLSFVSGTGLTHLQYFFSKKDDQFRVSTSSWDPALNHPAGLADLLTMKANSYTMLQAYFSGDRSKLLLHNSYFQRKTAMIDQEFAVLDVATGKVLFKGICSYSFERESPGTVSVDNDGNAYFGLTEYIRTGSKLSGKRKTREKLFVFLKEGTKKEYSFSYEGRYMQGIEVIQGEDNIVYVAGFSYGEGTKETSLSEAGLFIGQFSKDRLSLGDSAVITVKGLFPEKKLDEDDRIPYTVRNIYKKTTGGFVVVAEQYQSIVGQYSNTHKFNDIACIQLKNDLSFESATRIPKRQFGADNPSIICNFLNDRLYILYNDRQENLNATDEDIQYPANNKEKNGLFLLTIEPGGQQKKELIYGYDTGKPIPVIAHCYVMDNRTVFLSSGEQAGVLTFNH